MTAYTTKAGDRVSVHHAEGDVELFIVVCEACGEVDRIDYGPFERRCPDFDTANAAAQLVAAEHGQAHDADRREWRPCADCLAPSVCETFVEDLCP